MKKKHVNIGICSILMVFIILSLITLGLICLRVSQLNYDRANRLAMQITDYYDADILGEEYLEDILAEETLEDGVYENYIDINDSQRLHIVLELQDGIILVKDWIVEGKEVEIDTRQPVIILED